MDQRRSSLPVVLCLLCVGGLQAACAPQAEVLSGSDAAARAATTTDAAVATPHRATPAKASAAIDRYVGEWSYATECDSGHYVTLGLRAAGGGVAGEWSDGTQIGGSQGKLRGKMVGARLEVELCDEDGGAGGYSVCPQYTASENYFTFRDGALVWHQRVGKNFAEYVALQRLDATDTTRNPTVDEDCPEDQQGG